MLLRREKPLLLLLQLEGGGGDRAVNKYEKSARIPLLAVSFKPEVEGCGVIGRMHRFVSWRLDCWFVGWFIDLVSFLVN